MEAELQRLAAAKADQRSVDAALDGKVDLSLLKHKADRSFCEALLSRFSIEVG